MLCQHRNMASSELFLKIFNKSEEVSDSNHLITLYHLEFVCHASFVEEVNLNTAPIKVQFHFKVTEFFTKKTKGYPVG